MATMDWFEQLTGFREGNYEETRAKLKVDAGRLQSLVNGKSYRVGEFELVPLQTLRERARSVGGPPGGLKASVVRGDVRQMHRASEYAGALFQVASQFNALEMTSPNVTPEDGVTRYQYDQTQGPACAIAAGAATIYRNYFLPVAGGIGQTAKRQLDGLAAVGEALSGAVGRPIADLWHMRNGYAMCSREALDAISTHLAVLQPDQADALRGMLSIALQSDVEVTDTASDQGQLVSQAFCSALPIAYTNVPSRHWTPFASLVLEASYEATMWASVLNAQRGASNIVLLTLLGGGAFGNESEWIIDAMRRAMGVVSSFDIDARIVSYGVPSREILELAEEFT
jgi:hypothetical protein